MKPVSLPGGSNIFKHRGTDMLRIEALSDAVFAFSVSLLVASLEVPQTFRELKVILQAALPFFATVSLIFLFWYQQYIYFRHYALNDLYTILLNLSYLAVILFYVYPLKFLFSFLLWAWTGMELFPKALEHGETVLMIHEFPQLVITFSAGYFVIWTLLYLMHVHAFKQRLSLALNPYEQAFTRKEQKGAWWNAMIGLLAIVFSLTGIFWLPGICYLMIPVILIINEYRFRKRFHRLTYDHGGNSDQDQPTQTPGTSLPQ
jgi:uncharacterized membrane protein